MRRLKSPSINIRGVFFCVAVVCVLGSATQVQPWSGSGMVGDPYQIWTAADMQAIGADPNYWDAHFKQMADIDLGGYTGTSFDIIGHPGNSFIGVFDGNSHTISNFTYSSTGTDYIGLSGYVDDPNAEIKNLGLIDPNVNAGTGWNVGSLVGYNYSGTISSSYSTGSVSGMGNGVGGLIGYNSSSGTVSNSYSTGSVLGGTYVGGLVGYDNSGDYTKSFWDNTVNPDVNGIGNTTDPNSLKN